MQTRYAFMMLIGNGLLVTLVRFGLVGSFWGLGLCSLFFASASAQTISGNVVTNGVGIPDVEVCLYAPDGDVATCVTTDPSGAFTFDFAADPALTPLCETCPDGTALTDVFTVKLDTFLFW